MRCTLDTSTGEDGDGGGREPFAGTVQPVAIALEPTDAMADRTQLVDVHAERGDTAAARMLEQGVVGHGAIEGAQAGQDRIADALAWGCVASLFGSMAIAGLWLAGH